MELNNYILLTVSRTWCNSSRGWISGLASRDRTYWKMAFPPDNRTVSVLSLPPARVRWHYLLLPSSYLTPDLPWRHIFGWLRATEGLQKFLRNLLSSKATVSKQRSQVPQGTKGNRGGVRDTLNISSKIVWHYTPVALLLAQGSARFRHWTELHLLADIKPL